MNTDNNQPTRRASMTDHHTDHRYEAERMLADADAWASVAGELIPEASELSCLNRAQLHALFAIHDALTAADRYFANEERQREAEPEWPEGFDGLRENHGWGLLTRAEKQGIIERWIENQRLTAAEREAKAKKARADFAAAVAAANEERQRKAEADPLDEDNHSDRQAGDRRIVRHGRGHWHTPATSGTWCDADCTEMSLRHWARVYGPLTFAPEPPPEDSSTHYYPTNIDRAPDGTAWSWGVAECHCNRPWRHE